MRDLSFAPFPFSATLAIGEEEWIALCEKHGFKDRTWMAETSNGDVATYGSLAVVRFGDLSEQEPDKLAGICAHEAVHVFAGMCRYISEGEPSEEFTAYHIQAITEWLLKELTCFHSQASTSNSQEQQSLPSQSDGTSGETPE